ncbi:MAG TPA: hypothetical protein VM578_06995 [Candidatus Saccharimonadales bacterium]|nr:hypothetical protein [Candidatus Saccharimonadales bacterium]
MSLPPKIPPAKELPAVHWHVYLWLSEQCEVFLVVGVWSHAYQDAVALARGVIAEGWPHIRIDDTPAKAVRYE